MLKWAKTSQRRVSDCSDAQLETCSNLSSSDSSSESGIILPIRYHDKRVSRPKSLALSSTDVLDIDHEQSTFVSRRPQRTGSTPLYSSCSRANRHSMIVISKEAPDHSRLRHLTADGIPTHNNNNILKISTNPQEGNDSVLKISTTDGEKPKSRNSFWKNFRAKAQGKKTDKKLAKAHSISNLPAINKSESIRSNRSDLDTEILTDLTPTQPTTSDIESSSVILRKAQRPLAEATSPTRNNVTRRRSFKLLRKQNENKKPKAFSKNTCEPLSITPNFDGEFLPTESPDSGISSIRHPSNTDSDYEGRNSPVSPITPIDLGSNNPNLVDLKQQFTDAVLQYLNERLEKKGYNSVVDRTSSSSSIMSDDGAPDIFCYDTDTVARRPAHRPKPTVELSH
ncbi:hypothetical protein EB796_019584 [Bugula neritina]|uniref:Uncharacterized protein n=1 Tax=Bugula neritina TaxID=10212 RepID=A0A7J7J849_BUGNE|nr:hypothetical protein EB796_019584 [Bugula neritina]